MPEFNETLTWIDPLVEDMADECRRFHRSEGRLPEEGDLANAVERIEAVQRGVRVVDVGWDSGVLVIGVEVDGVVYELRKTVLNRVRESG